MCWNMGMNQSAGLLCDVEVQLDDNEHYDKKVVVKTAQGLLSSSYVI